MKHLFTLLLLSFSLAGYGQGHTGTLGCRAYHDAHPKVYAYGGEGLPACQACIKADEAAYVRALAEADQKYRDLMARIAQEKADRAADVEGKRAAQQKALADRRTAALSQLAAAEKGTQEFDRINQADQERRAAVRRKFQQQEEQANQAYRDYLRQMQDAMTATASAAPEEFWNETAPMAGYEPVQHPQTRLWGYRNKQQKQVIDFKYERGIPFHQGVAVVVLNDKAAQTSTRLLINARDEVVRRFDKAYYDATSRNGRQVTDLTKYTLFSEGLLVVDCRVKPIDAQATTGCIDTKGDLVIAPNFYTIQPFKNGVAEASRLEKEDNFKFKNDYPGEFRAQFTYLEVGLIDRVGKWVAPPKNKLVYTYGNYDTSMYLVVSSASDPVLSEEESRAQKAANALRKKTAQAASMKKLEAEVQRRVDAARSLGYLTEGPSVRN